MDRVLIFIGCSSLASFFQNAEPNYEQETIRPIEHEVAVPIQSNSPLQYLCNVFNFSPKITKV